ncbi:hypothetical protein CR161_03805 [Prosthecochloris sp. ZM]|uniref:hypothetical protein n=1 Tax=Prosthecochloris sp. ZM TaxID=2283143 RepID=UPI000DF78B3A|nr:hypothetical protein [Prosthecochloris sp. ZM]RDD29902.1 hypothetical protein CR161_03805 [Prosthecochloris sp. ZM]
MKKDDIMVLNGDQLRELALEQQRKIERLYKAQVKLKRQVEAKEAVISHLQRNNTRQIVDAVRQLVPFNPGELRGS